MVQKRGAQMLLETRELKERRKSQIDINGDACSPYAPNLHAFGHSHY